MLPFTCVVSLLIKLCLVSCINKNTVITLPGCLHEVQLPIQKVNE